MEDQPTRPLRVLFAEHNYNMAIKGRDAIREATKNRDSPEDDTANAYAEFCVARARLDLSLARRGMRSFGDLL